MDLRPFIKENIRPFLFLFVTPFLGVIIYLFISIFFEKEANRYYIQLIFSRFLLSGALIAALIPIKNSLALIRTFFLFKGSSLNLAFFRILFYGFSGGIVGPFVFLGFINPEFPWADLPFEAREHLPMMGWFIDKVPITHSLVSWSFKLALLSAFFAMVGLFTRGAMILNVICVFYIVGLPNFFGKVNNDHHMLWFSMVLACSPTFDRFSIDAWIRKRRKKVPINTEDSIHYGLPIRVILFLMGIIYFFPGFWKAWSHGLDWALTDNVRNQLYFKWSKMQDWKPLFRIDHYPVIYKVSGLATMIFELGFIFMLFSPGRRIVASIEGLLFHRFTSWFMNIQFYTLFYCYVIFLDWEKLFVWLRIITKKEKQPTRKLDLKGIDIFRKRKTRYVAVVGSLLILVNILCGAFQVVSWPFTCYPTFHNLINNKTQSLKFVLKTQDGKSKMLDKTVLHKKYSLERYQYWEDQLFFAFQKDDEAEKQRIFEKITNFWYLEGQKRGDSLIIYKEDFVYNPNRIDFLESIESRKIYSIAFL